MQQITVEQLQTLLTENPGIQLIDVREAFEHEAGHIGGVHIPYGEILDQQDLIPKDRPVILYCEKGIRSQIAIQRLQQKGAWKNLLNLSGGMQAWRQLASHKHP